MPKIDPNQLLGCLDSLLGSDGGIKGETEVKRLVVLMTKFSKKLVSKCIYILILKSTEPDLLAKFMADGGWALVFQWLDEGIHNNNYPLIREILELLLKCPISLDRLKENNCPKVVKGLSKDSECEEVKLLAGKLVEQWLKFIKSGQAAISDESIAAASTAPLPKPSITVLPNNITLVSTVPLGGENKKPRSVGSKPGIKIVRDVSSSEDDEEVVPAIGTLPLYKITVRDGKSVFAKVGTKTVTLPVSKSSESEKEAHSVASVVLKSDPITKKFHYVTKQVTDKKEGIEVHSVNDSGNREKSDISKSVNSTSDNILKQKIILTEKIEIKKIGGRDSLEKEKSSENKSKHSSSKSHKDTGKSRDDHVKVSKSVKDHESGKSEQKQKDREKRSDKDSEKDKRKSDHKSSKTEKSRDRDREKSRDKDKDKERSKNKEKHKDGERDKNKVKDVKEKLSKDKDAKVGEKTMSAAEKAQIQADKDKSTLERLKTPAISLLGKIPKKPSSQSNAITSKSAGDNGTESSESLGGEAKKPLESRGKIRPKTVKTFNSKFRSTGLEEEIKPPPPRSSLKKKSEDKKPPSKIETSFKPSSQSTVHGPSSASKEGPPPEKKPKIAEVAMDVKKEKILEKPGGIKLIPPKPKPALLESDMFSDALTASTKFEPRKRKRRTSSSKESSEPKKEIKEENGSGTPTEVTSPKELKPTLKFYRDTLEEDEEKNKENAPEIKQEPKVESDSEDSVKQSGNVETIEISKPGSKLYPNGVLICKARKGPKKTVKWKEDSELTSVRLFELDETERVNVTRTFVDMKLMERSHEREAFQLARKLATDDTMEEKVPWGPLYEVDIPPDRRSTAEPGKSSLEKNVQYAREKTVLQAIYFHRSSIPDSPSEPDPEIHPTTDPKIIPLDDITGNSDSVSNFTNIPWPEPKPTLAPSSPPLTHQGASQHQQPPLAQQMQHPQGFPPGFSNVGGFPGFPQMGVPGIMPPGQGNWRGGDGKDMGMNMGFQPNGPMCPQMGQPPNMFNAGGPEGFPMNGPPMGGFNPGFPMPCDPNNMYGPPMGGMGMGGPPPGQWNRGGGGWQGGRPFMGNMPPKFQKGVCHHFAKFGNCARGSSCRFMHPN